MENLKNQITKTLGPCQVQILDPRRDGVHLEAIVVSERFNSLSLLERHRLVMNSLKKQFKEDLHALALKTYTLAEWEAINNDK